MVKRLVPFQKRALSLMTRGSSFCVSLFFIFALLLMTPARAGELPKFFTYLKAVDPSILQEMRYYGSHNFLGRPVKGYQAAECILTLRAAKALKKVQSRLRSQGLALKVYDCYRPQRAVNDFIGWAKKPNDQKTKAEFYPTLKKSKLFGLGYIARRSTHSRGSTVDLTIVPLPAKLQPKHDLTKQVACFEDAGERFADNSLDFGTGYDCFHEKSHTKSPVILTARQNRDLLVREMAAAGFENYRKEWWHFSLKNEPYRRKHFDFPITPYKGDVSSSIQKDAANKDRLALSDKTSLQRTNDQTVKSEGVLDKSEIASSLKTRNNKTLRVVCVASDDVLNVREAAHHKSKIVTALPSDAVGIEFEECRGSLSLDDWHGLDGIARKTVAPPWCRIHSYKLAVGGASIEAFGWVSGAFVSSDLNKRSCK